MMCLSISWRLCSEGLSNLAGDRSIGGQITRQTIAFIQFWSGGKLDCCIWAECRKRWLVRCGATWIDR